MAEENAEVTVETTETVESMQAKLAKAEAKIVEMKKSTTPAEPEPVTTETNGFDDAAFERKYDEKKFFEANPNMSEYKEQLTEYVNKGISYDKAKALVELDDPTIANRKVAQKTNFTSWEAHIQQVTYTMAELWELPQNEYNKVMALKAKGEVNIT